MPRVKTYKFSIGDHDAELTFEKDIMVNTDGVFYVAMEEEIAELACDVVKDMSVIDVRYFRDELKLQAGTCVALEQAISTVYSVKHEPKTTRELVIRYNIESHVAFAEDAEGNVFPNARYPGARWLDNLDGGKFGNHHACNTCTNGYSLTVGAVALVKTTLRYDGGHEKSEYSPYYGEDGSHHGYSTPAEKLNSWCSFTMPKRCKEIPYTDGAALFFHDLLMSMAVLSKKVQELTGDEYKLLEVINNGVRLLRLPTTKQDEEN